jgi:hypothetical protein
MPCCAREGDVGDDIGLVVAIGGAVVFGVSVGGGVAVIVCVGVGGNVAIGVPGVSGVGLAIITRAAVPGDPKEERLGCDKIAAIMKLSIKKTCPHRKHRSARGVTHLSHHIMMFRTSPLSG